MFVLRILIFILPNLNIAVFKFMHNYLELMKTE